MDYSKMDELLEERYENDFLELEELQDFANDETFDSPVANGILPSFVTKDQEFDFTNSQLPLPANNQLQNNWNIPHAQTNISNNYPLMMMNPSAPAIQHRQPILHAPVTFEEIEAQMKLQAQNQRIQPPQFVPPPIQIQNMHIPPIMTAEQLEYMMRNSLRNLQNQTSTMVPPVASTSTSVVEATVQISTPIDVTDTPQNKYSPAPAVKIIPLPQKPAATIISDTQIDSKLVPESSSLSFDILKDHQTKEKKPHFEKIKRLTQNERKSAQKQQSNSASVDKNEYHFHQFQKENSFNSIESIPQKPHSYNNMMKQWEKEHIAKIQISQLVSDDPLKDDFYYQIYNSVGVNPLEVKISLDVKEKGNKKQKKLSGPMRMQQQMQKLIDKRKQKREEKTHLTLEGSLGKISISSSRNPRQVLEVFNPVSNLEDSSEIKFTLSARSILESIEDAYETVLNLESIKRNPSSDEYNSKLENEILILWKKLGFSEVVPFSVPHPFAFYLKYAKGMRLIPRILKFLNQEQIFILFNTLLTRLECVEIAKVNVHTENEQVDMFVSIVVPHLVDFVSDSTLAGINTLMKSILERHSLVWLSKSKVGLALLTMFLSRAEILKQGAQENLDEQDLSLWTEIYNFLFASLQGNFTSLFSGKSQSSNHSGEIYIWQFLASLAVGSTSADQQRTLVTEVREHIIETAKRESDEKALANVNLFLNALGLGIDASQLAAMSSKEQF